MLYVHIPFCKGKCIYCSFYSGGNPDWKQYNKALLNELSFRREEIKESLTSLYIGGGTPSLMSAEDFGSLVSDLKSHLNEFLPENINSEEFEFTIEINPEDVTYEKIEVWKEAGVNRVSMGIQTLNDEELLFLKRRHNSLTAIKSSEMLRKAFDNLSLDIIYGIPGQNSESLDNTISTLLKLNPDHVSAYSLTYEEGTPLNLYYTQKKIAAVSDEESNIMREFIDSRLKDNGFERYEISNYARRGKRSRHNSGYWSNKAYLGLGPSASSFDGTNVRRNNPADLKKYLAYFGDDSTAGKNSDSKSSFFEEDRLSEENRLTEKIFLRLRTKEGINQENFIREFGEEQLNRLLESCKKWEKRGDIVITDKDISLSAKGISISDMIALDLLP